MMAGEGDGAPKRGNAFHDYLLRQYLLQRSAYKRDIKKMGPAEAVDFIRWNVLAAQVELAEVLDEAAWKPWATYDTGEVFKNRDKFVEELVDVLHFIANLLLAAGVNDDELSSAFAAKQEKNAARQQTLYDGDGDAWDKENTK